MPKEQQKNFTHESYISDDLVNTGDRVSYKKEAITCSYYNFKGIKVSKKTLENGVVIVKLPSVENLSPKFLIENENGNIDEVVFGNIIEIIK